MCGRRRRARRERESAPSFAAARQDHPAGQSALDGNSAFDAWEREARARIDEMRAAFTVFRAQEQDRERRRGDAEAFRHFMEERHPGLVQRP